LQQGRCRLIRYTNGGMSSAGSLADFRLQACIWKHLDLAVWIWGQRAGIVQTRLSSDTRRARGTVATGEHLVLLNGAWLGFCLSSWAGSKFEISIAWGGGMQQLFIRRAYTYIWPSFSLGFDRAYGGILLLILRAARSCACVVWGVRVVVVEQWLFRGFFYVSWCWRSWLGCHLVRMALRKQLSIWGSCTI